MKKLMIYRKLWRKTNFSKEKYHDKDLMLNFMVKFVLVKLYLFKQKSF